jgi:hypothetical protein
VQPASRQAGADSEKGKTVKDVKFVVSAVAPRTSVVDGVAELPSFELNEAVAIDWV